MEKTAILFSGGRDSCVLLHILEPWLNEMTVLWCNTGAAYESTHEQMREVRRRVPNFQEVRSDQPKDIALWGYPTDVLPLRHSVELHGTLTPRLQTSFACCAKNIWIPLYLWCKDNDVKNIFYGSREEEDMKDPRWDRTDADGISHCFPMRRWTKKMLLDYIAKHNIAIPPYYEKEEKSRDCWNCTAYLWERRASIDNLTYNDKAAVKQRLEEINDVLHEESKVYREIISS